MHLQKSKVSLLESLLIFNAAMLKLKEKLKFIVIMCAMLTFVVQPLAAVSMSCSTTHIQSGDNEAGSMAAMMHASGMNHEINAAPDTIAERSVTSKSCCSHGVCAMANCLYSPVAFASISPKFQPLFHSVVRVFSSDTYQTLAFPPLFRPPISR